MPKDQPWCEVLQMSVKEPGKRLPREEKLSPSISPAVHARKAHPTLDIPKG